MELKPEQGAAAGQSDASLAVDQILSESKLKPADEGYDIARRGVQAFITEMLAPGRSEERVDKSLVDQMISEIDARMSAQVNEIMHHPGVAEARNTAWRGLRISGRAHRLPREHPHRVAQRHQG